MNSNCLLAFTEVMTHADSDTISTETGTTVKCFYYKLEYFTEFLSLSRMDLAINNVSNLCNFVGKLVCVCISLLSTFITFSIIQNPFDTHIAYFNQNG